MQMTKSDLSKMFSKLNLEVRSTKHVYGWLVVEGKKILRVHYSHGKGDLPGKIGDKIRNQLKLTRNDFKDLIDCPLSREGYLDILKKKGMIE